MPGLLAFSLLLVVSILLSGISKRNVLSTSLIFAIGGVVAGPSVFGDVFLIAVAEDMQYIWRPESESSSPATGASTPFSWDATRLCRCRLHD